jgi:hypothetical protein
MPFTYHGCADVTVSELHTHSDRLDHRNPYLTITLGPNGPAHIARLEFAQALLGPEHANRIHVQLPDGRSLAGRLLAGDRSSDGRGWLLFDVDNGDWGQLA